MVGVDLTGHFDAGLGRTACRQKRTPTGSTWMFRIDPIPTFAAPSSIPMFGKRKLSVSS
jgi:hypothetical protein